MAIQSIVTVVNQFLGDLVSTLSSIAAQNNSSPGELVVQRLTIGNNTISPPVTTGIIVTGLTIIPPVGNVNLITLKGVNGDTGIPLHKTNPTFIALDVTFTTLVLNAAAQIDALRLIWS